MSSEVDGRAARAGRRWPPLGGLLRRKSRAAKPPASPPPWDTIASASARRTLGLVDRLIRRLDKLEFGEEDPGRLADLFELDHLVTQIRHNEESLLVLTGAGSARAKRGAESLTDVLRAAQSEVEQYTRVEIEVADLDLCVAASAANDLVHLVAELVDNATKYSTPDTTVTVLAERPGDKLLIHIADRGLGIDDAELRRLNERLAGGDGSAEAMLGLAVVARLAGRHGVTVELKRAEDGIVAEVAVPAELVMSIEATPEPVPTTLPRRPVREPLPLLTERVRAAIGTMSREPVKEENGEFHLRRGAARILVRVRNTPPMVDVVCPLISEVEASDELYTRLSELTADMPVGRLYWAGGTVWGSVPVFGHDFQETHLKLAVQVMAGLATELQDRTAWP